MFMFITFWPNIFWLYFFHFMKNSTFRKLHLHCSCEKKKKIIKRTYHSMDNLMIINNMSKLVARTIIWHYKRNFVSFLVLFTQVNEPLLQPHPPQKKYPYDTTLNSHELLRQSDTKHLFILYVLSRLKNP